jgi:alpha-L-arabinofuranosidase
MKKYLSFIAAVLLSSCIHAADVTPAYSIMGKDTTCQIFLYSPGDKMGLHLAYLGDDEKWRDVGQLCGSDYSRWGSEKRMYSPYVVHANDGTWRAVWSVNDYSPCIATAYSEDLVTWRPQNFPLMSVKGCKDPIAFVMDDGTFDIYFHSSKGNRYVQASNDFRTFKEAEDSSTIEDIAWLKDSAVVDNKLYLGNLFDVPKIHLSYIIDYFAALKSDADMSSERMAQDATRFQKLPQTVNATLNVDMQEQKTISDKLIGVFFEDISYAADGGLYAELVQNRDFEYTTKDHKGWSATTAWSSKSPIVIGIDNPLSKSNPHYAVLAQDTLVNEGWDGIAAKYGAKYDFSFFVRNIDVDKKQFEVALVAKDGTLLAKQKVKTVGNAWNKYEAVLDIIDKKVVNVDMNDCRLIVIPLKKGSSAVDMISLFPEDTFHGHKNGLRKDLAQTIADLHPKFVRFPGGCMSHGDGLDNIYHWNHTVGALQDRVPDFNIWGYHQTRGLGFYEYFQFCEDIGAEPLPVLAAGVPCQNSACNANGFGGQQGGIPMADMPAYCQEILDMIEWANGDPATSKWAKMRADAGHPAPFNLKYVGIGNEDLISNTFEERYLMICKAIKQKYPNITICGTVGPFHNPSSDYVEGWKLAKDHQDIIDMVDEHYYESPGWFLHHQDYYDDYDRTAPKVYLGEYASRTRTQESALVEAIHLCNVERNGDVVSMTSYAPLLAKDKHNNWNPDMIYFSNTDIRTTPSYETQRIFSKYAGDKYITSSIEMDNNLKYRVAASVVKDSKTGKVYLKLVNALPVTLKLNVKGLNIPAGSSIEGFEGNIKDGKVSVKTETVDGATITMPAYSVRAITL